MPIQSLFHRGAQSTRKQSGASILLLLLLVLPAMHAIAHDFWIEPTKFRVQEGEKTALRLLVGQDFKGNAALYNPAQFERYFFTSPGGERPVIGRLGDDPAGTVTTTGPGLYIVGFFSKQFEVTFDSFQKFEEYLIKEGLERNLPLARKRSGQRGGVLEVYWRCAKSLIAAPQAESGAADRVFGFPLELVSETNPYRQSELRLQLLYRGQPLAGAQVAAFTKTEPLAKLRARSDQDGRVVFKLPRAGVWLVTSVHQIPAPWYARADWESYWASLTFELPPR
jgi:hypothetical protein